MSEAEKCKALGNQKYGQGKLKEAISFYKQASELDPTVPVYLSNLAAAQFEDGHYSAATKTCTKALNIISPNDLAFRQKVSQRLEKARLILSHDHSDDNSDAALEFGDASRTEAAKRQRIARSAMKNNLINRRLASIPRYRHSSDDTLEYYVVGHDQAVSILQHQGPSGNGPLESLHLKIPRSGKEFDFAALFCGIGDARHLYASIADLGGDCPTPVPANVKAHFTIIDIHPSALARDLVIMFTLDELASIENKESQRAKHLLLMLHYVYWSWVMPPLAERILDQMLERVYEQVSLAVQAEAPLSNTWLYVEPESCRGILERLQWWRTDGKTAVDFDEMLPLSANQDEMMSKLPAADRALITQQQRERKNMLLESLTSPGRIGMTRQTAMMQGKSLEAYLDDWRNMSDAEFNRISSQAMKPPAARGEFMAYPHLMVLVPPADCDEPTVLEEKIFKPIRSCDSQEVPSKILRAAHDKFIAKRWKINYTRLAKDWIDDRDRTEQDPFDICMDLLPRDEEERYKIMTARRSGGLYTISERFFLGVARGMKKLQGHFRIEAILGDGFAVMDEIKLKTLRRLEGFPVLFDRVHASNVPDYVGGLLATVTTGTSLLKSHNKAYFTSCDLLHSGKWEGGLLRPDLFALSLSSRMYTYTGALYEEMASAFGISLIGNPLPPNEYHMFRRLEKVSLLSRDNFTAVATTCFLRTVLPATYTRLVDCVMQVREVQNVHTFFRALELWKGMGYPLHILADLVEQILTNQLKRSAPPHAVVPTPVSDRRRPLVSVCTLPFLAEFEVAAALWEPRLFPIPSSAMISPADIRRYSVRIPLQSIRMLENVLPSPHMVLLLVFGSPKEMDATSMDIRSKIINTSWDGSLQFVSTFDYDCRTSKCTVLLSRKRLSAYVDLGYEVGLVNASGWKLQSAKMPCAKMTDVGDVDMWDKTIEIPAEAGRGMLGSQVDSWVSSISSSATAQGLRVSAA